jgi:hypothetical protein
MDRENFPIFGQIGQEGDDSTVQFIPGFLDLHGEFCSEGRISRLLKNSIAPAPPRLSIK